MSSTVALDLFNATHCEDGYQELLVPTMTTIKPAYRWAIRGFVTTCAIMIATGIVTSEEHISVKIVGVGVLICAVWYTFLASADALVYRTQRIESPPHESMV
ncbi:hypothetical protein PVAP13_5KG694900 [Panicum virgatum]|uniref:Uncharacterized protein n=1 Tax=Panicum virgatum TaxID=38727 RepID=A0A8T0T2L3_PANVG|nr:hypothetical protein PVAP13_5KG694900 [Panicum virgatum]